MTKSNLLFAMHEAGHAVAMLANDDPPGPYIEFASLVGLKPGVAGLVKREPRWWSHTSDAIPQGTPAQIAQYISAQRRYAELDIIEKMAGPVAEIRYVSRSWENVEEEGLGLCLYCLNHEQEPGSDLDGIRARIFWLHPDDRHEQFHNYWNDSIAIIKEKWRYVEHLGRWLAAKGHIDGPEIYDWWTAAQTQRRVNSLNRRLSRRR